MSALRDRALGRWLARGATLAALGGIGATQTGCIEIAIVLALTADDEPPPADTPDPVAPDVTIDIADWPPVGPSGVVTVHAESPNGISQADLEFRNLTTLYGTSSESETFQATGAQLGEGLGELSVLVHGADGATTEAYVEDLLVDLTPPEVVLGPTTLPAAGASFDFWMGDAWVLGSAEISFGGTTLREELPAGYPSTLGTAWDYSLVRFDVESLPAVSAVATLTVTDAAGNVREETFALSIDGEPPATSFLSPAAGDVVRGAFEVEVEAYDSQPGPVAIDLFAGGSIVATGSGPTCTFVLAAEELPAGQLDLTAVATDEAGNRSTAAHLAVRVEHDDPPPDDPPGAE